MKTFLFITLSVILTYTYSFSFCQDSQLPQRKSLIFETVLVKDRKPNGVIVGSKEPELQKLALQIQTAIKKATGIKLPVVSDETVATHRGELLSQEPVKNMIILGNLDNNGLVAHLYFKAYCAADANYPGKDNYIIQTISDPWATGANAIVLGGSNFKGIEGAVNRFCADLPKGSTLSIPRTLRAEGTGTFQAPDLSDSDIAKKLAEAEVEFKAGKHNGLFPSISGAANTYNLYGKEGYAKLCRDLIFLEHHLMKTSPNEFDSPWGSGADMQFASFIAAWDNVEESPSISDADREKVLRITLEYIKWYEGYGYIRGFKSSIIRHNHHTFPGQGFSAAGRYFSKYYPAFSGGPKWLAMGDDCFRVQQQAWKSQEDCSAYLGLAMRHMCNYSASRTDLSWFDSGKAKIAGDIPIMTMDNLGRQCAYGDTQGWTTVSHFPLWNYLTALQRDGRFAWALMKAKAPLKKSSEQMDSLLVNVAPVEPTDLLGTKCMPLDSLFYVSLNGKGTVPRPQTFDKISFRSSFDPEKQYMVIDGINVGYHGHRDGNSVLRLSDKGRIWLADGDYIKTSPKYHNTLLIFKDGQSSDMPPFIKRELVSDLPSVGMTRTTTVNYGGADWSRNIIWDKERSFVFIDEVKANSDNAYSVRTVWHTLGIPSMQNNTFSLTQQGKQLHIQNLDGSQLRNFRDVEVGKNWVGYEYADPVINTLQQNRSAVLKQGEKIYIINVFSADSVAERQLEAFRIDESSVLLGKGNKQTLIGTGKVSLPNLETDATIYWISKEGVALSGVRNLKINNKLIFQAADTISAELSAESVLLSADRPTAVTFNQTSNMVKLDGQAVNASAGSQSFTLSLSPGKHLLTGVSLPGQFDWQFPAPSAATVNTSVNLGSKKLTEKARFIPEQIKSQAAFAAGKDGIYMAGAKGLLYALSKDAKPRWTYQIGGDISAVWSGKLGINSLESVVVGNTSGKIVVLDQAGKPLWEQQIPLHRGTQAPVYFMSADLSGKGDRALIVGSSNWYHYAFDNSGKLLWKYLSIHPSTTGTTADLDGDGKQEIIAGTSYYNWHGISPEGKQIWNIRGGGPGANAIAAADLSSSGKRTTYIAAADGNLYAVEPDGKRPWTYNTGDGATSIEFMDVNGDGKNEILVGTLTSNLLALRADGTRLWRRDIGEPILCMLQADVNKDKKPEIIVGTEDGHVIVLDKDGQPQASWTSTGPVSKMVALDGGKIAVLNSEGNLVVLGL